jgi:hypothetical protein
MNYTCHVFLETRTSYIGRGVSVFSGLCFELALSELERRSICHESKIENTIFLLKYFETRKNWLVGTNKKEACSEGGLV